MINNKSSMADLTTDKMGDPTAYKYFKNASYWVQRIVIFLWSLLTAASDFFIMKSIVEIVNIIKYKSSISD